MGILKMEPQFVPSTDVPQRTVRRILPVPPGPQVTPKETAHRNTHSNRELPVPPAKREIPNAIRFNRNLPRVPRPLGLMKNPLASSLQTSTEVYNQVAIPVVPKPTRQLPKLPSELADDNKKRHLHDIHREEGDMFMKERNYEKALDSYTTALKLVPDQRLTLVARSRCHQLLGQNKRAMKDAEMALKLDPNFYQALLQKAEILYSNRDYEMALLCYEQGLKQKPEMEEFRLGIKLTRDAMKAGQKQSIPTAYEKKKVFVGRKVRQDQIKRFNNGGPTRLSPILHSPHCEIPSPKPFSNKHFQNASSPKLVTNNTRLKPLDPIQHFGSHDNVRIEYTPSVASSEEEKGAKEVKRSEKEEAPADKKTPPQTDALKMTENQVKHVIGKMYNDKRYFEKLIKETDTHDYHETTISDLSEAGLNMLYDRVLHWVRQGRVIPPEAPDSRLNTAKSKSLKSGTTVYSRDDASQKHKKDLSNVHIRGREERCPKFGSLYSEKKKCEVSNRKEGKPNFIQVVTGKGIHPKDNVDIRKQLSPIRRPKQSPSKLRPGESMGAPRRQSKDNLSVHVLSDSDSGLNVSFGSHKGHSEYDYQASKESSTLTYGKSDPPSGKSTPRPTLKPPAIRRNKRERGPRFEIRKESILSFVQKSLEDIELAYVDGKYMECMKKAEACLNAMQGYSEEELPNRAPIVAKLHSYIGNAAIEQRDYVRATEHHEMDLALGERYNDDECISRALGNIGRIYVFQNKHQKALELFARKVPMCKTRQETAWLYHEIGNCFLVQQQYEYATEAAKRSLEAAEEALDWNYQLQSGVLLGVSQVKLRKYHDAFNSFERSLDQARVQGDMKAEKAIRDALNDVNDRIMDELKNSYKQDFQARSRADVCRSRAEMSDYSSIYIPDDDWEGTSLTETGYDGTENLQLDLEQIRSDLESSMIGSVVKTGRQSGFMQSDFRGSVQNINVMSRQSWATNNTYRCNTAMA